MIACANLRLQPKKCLFIPTALPFSETLVKDLTAWLHRYVPKWSQVRIASAGKYQGFFVGQGASDYQWLAPLARYSKRAATVAQVEAGPLLSIYKYNSAVAPVLGYVAQTYSPTCGDSEH